MNGMTERWTEIGKSWTYTPKVLTFPECRPNSNIFLYHFEWVLPTELTLPEGWEKITSNQYSRHDGVCIQKLDNEDGWVLIGRGLWESVYVYGDGRATKVTKGILRISPWVCMHSDCNNDPESAFYLWKPWKNITGTYTRPDGFSVIPGYMLPTHIYWKGSVIHKGKWPRKLAMEWIDKMYPYPFTPPTKFDMISEEHGNRVPPPPEREVGPFINDTVEGVMITALLADHTTEVRFSISFSMTDAMVLREES